MDMDKICFGCFNECTTDVCPHCGFVKNSEQPLLALPLGTILAGRYMTGKVLGMGGFGVTYLGYDLTLETKVAIKEYLPSGMAARGTDRYTMTVITGSDNDSYVSGQDKFLEEARILAKVQNVPNIVSVQNYFKENNTAYFVMSYVDGMSLKDYLKKQGGRLSYEETLRILKPVMEALCSVHALNLLHRDISTDNIYITTQGESKLLDFGAARFALGDEKSVSVILKHGYAPEEQYRSHGNQGPWTDVYAMGATIYNCVTGTLPPDSIDRLHEDAIIPPRQVGAQISAQQEAAILKALAVHAEDRFSNMRDMIDALCGNAHVSGSPAGAGGYTAMPGAYQTYAPGNMTQQNAPDKNGSKGGVASFIERLKTDRKMLIIVCAACAAVIIAIILMIVLIPRRKETASGGDTGSKYISASSTTTKDGSDAASTPAGTSTDTSAATSAGTSSDTSAATSSAALVTEPYTNETFGFSMDVVDGYTTTEKNSDSYVMFSGDNSVIMVYYAFYAAVPIYSADDFANNTDTIMASLSPQTNPTVTNTGYLKLNGKQAYGVEYETDTVGGVMLMVETGENYGGYFLVLSVKKGIAEYDTRMDELIAMTNSFNVTGTLVSNAALYENSDLGFKFMYYPAICTPVTQVGVEGRIDCAYLRYDESDIANEIEIEKGDSYASDPQSALTVLGLQIQNTFTAENDASYSASEQTTNTGYGDYDVFEVLYSLSHSGKDTSVLLAAADIEGQTFVVGSFYDTDHADNAEKLKNVVLSTLRPIK